MRLKEEMLVGVQCAIDVDTWGRFVVTPLAAGNHYLASEKTLDDAIEKAKRALSKRKVKLHIPFVSLDGEAGVATGVHSGTGYVMARVGGESMQLSNYTMRKVFPADIPASVRADYDKARHDKAAAEQVISRIETEYVIDLDNVVGEALDKQVRAGGAPIDVDRIEAEKAAAGPVA